MCEIQCAEWKVFLIRSYVKTEKEKATKTRIRRVRLYWKQMRTQIVTNYRQAGILPFDCRQTLRMVGHDIIEGPLFSSSDRFRPRMNSTMLGSFRDSSTKAQETSYSWTYGRRQTLESFCILLVDMVRRSDLSVPSLYAHEITLLGGFEPPAVSIVLDQQSGSTLSESFTESGLAEMIYLHDGFDLKYTNGDRLIAFEFSTYIDHGTLHLVRAGQDLIPVPSANPEHILLHLLVIDATQLFESDQMRYDSAIVEYLKGLESGFKTIAASLLSPILCDEDNPACTPSLLLRMVKVLRAKLSWWNLFKKHILDRMVNILAQEQDKSIILSTDSPQLPSQASKSEKLLEKLRLDLAYSSSLQCLELEMSQFLTNGFISSADRFSDIALNSQSVKYQSTQTDVCQQPPVKNYLTVPDFEQVHQVGCSMSIREHDPQNCSCDTLRKSGKAKLSAIIKQFTLLIFQSNPSFIELFSVRNLGEPYVEAFKKELQAKTRAFGSNLPYQVEYPQLHKLCSVIKQLDQRLGSRLHLANTTFVEPVSEEDISLLQRPEEFHSLTSLAGRELIVPTADRSNVRHRFVANYGGKIFIISEGRLDKAFHIWTLTEDKKGLTEISKYPVDDITFQNSQFVYHRGRILEVYTSACKVLLVNLQKYASSTEPITYHTRKIGSEPITPEKTNKKPDVVPVLTARLVHILRFEYLGTKTAQKGAIILESYPISANDRIQDGMWIDLVDVTKYHNTRTKVNLDYRSYNCCVWAFELHKLFIVAWIIPCRIRRSKKTGWSLLLNIMDMDENYYPKPDFRMLAVTFPGVTFTDKKRDQPSSPIAFTHYKHIFLLMISAQQEVRLVRVTGQEVGYILKAHISAALQQVLAPNSGFSPVHLFEGQIPTRGNLLRVQKRRPHSAFSHSTYQLGRIALKVL